MFTSFKIQSKHIMIGLLLFAWLPVQASQMETKNKETSRFRVGNLGILAEERKVFMSAFKMGIYRFFARNFKDQKSRWILNGCF